jgi:hypothetical protein
VNQFFLIVSFECAAYMQEAPKMPLLSCIVLPEMFVLNVRHMTTIYPSVSCVPTAPPLVFHFFV